jgi:hypothetical protein
VRAASRFPSPGLASLTVGAGYSPRRPAAPPSGKPARPGPLWVLSAVLRRAIYAAVAEARSRGLLAPLARAVVGVRLHLSVDAVTAVERAGVAAGWPRPVARTRERLPWSA